MLSKGHRAIGVVYELGFESGNYVPTILAERYDGLVYISKTKALDPLDLAVPDREKAPGLYPVNR